MPRPFRTGTKRVALIGAGLGLGLATATGALIYANTRPPPPEASEAKRMPPVNALPGGPNNTAALNELREREAADKARQAERAGRSYATAMGGSDEWEPGAMAAPPRRVEVSLPQAQRPPQPPKRSDPDDKQVTRYDDAIRRLIRAWDGEPAETAMHSDILEASAKRAAAARRRAAEVEEARNRGQEKKARRVLLPGNTGVYGVVKLGANSDTPGAPIVIDLHGGPLDGLRANGSYGQTTARNGSPQGDLIRVSRLTLADGRTVPVNAVLVSPEDMTTAAASRIDPHTAERIVYPMAAAFASGLGRALALGGGFIAGGPFGYTQGFRDFNAAQLLGIGAGAAGQAAGQILREQAPRQSTRYVDATSEVGVFFLDAVEVEE